MKKHILFGVTLLMAAAFTACNEDFEDWASPITNPEPEAITIPGVQATVAASNVDLGSASDAVQLVAVSAANAPEGTTFDKMRITVTPNGVADAEPKTLQATAAGDGTFTFERDVLQETVVEYFGRRPSVRTLDAHVYLDGIYQGQAAYIDAGEVQLTLIPEAPVIAQNYYIVGGALDWAASAASKEQKFQHSDLDVYEDPVFTIIFDAAEGDTWFAIGDDEGCDAIAGGDWSKLFGIVGGENEATSGTLDYRYNLGADNSFKMPAGPKRIKVVIDMMERTFQVTPVNIADAYYLIGGPGAWDNSKDQKFSHSDKDVSEDPIFTYVLESTGGEMWFAFGDEEAIDAVGEGTWNKLFGTTGASEDLSGSFDRRYNLDGDHSFHVDGQAKRYRFQVNMAEMTYTITPLNFDPYIYFIGATDGWANAEQKLALTDESGIYTGYIYCADPNGWGNEFKFQQVPGDWGTELNTGTFTSGISGDFAGGDEAGSNIKAVAGEGVYFVTADMASLTLNAVRINNMNLVGDFNGWNAADDAQQMTWDAENYCYVITGAGVTANGWKFTTNNSWDINLGGDTLNDLVANGANITAVGTTIKLYPTRRNADKIYCTVE